MIESLSSLAREIFVSLVSCESGQRNQRRPDNPLFGPIARKFVY